MANQIIIEPSKTYATAGNAVKAVEKSALNQTDARYIIAIHTDGRFYPLFIGERSIVLGAHHFFNCVN